MEPARPRRPHRGRARPLTVAELVTLHGGPPGEPVRAAGLPVSVGALLRREGRAPHALDRPTVPRGHSRPAEEPPAPAVHGGRRVTVATGAVLMVGAVLGTAVVNESVVAQPHTTPDTGSATPAAGAAAAGDPARAAHQADQADRPVTVSYFAPLTTAVPPGFDLPVASGGSIGRDALGSSPAAGTPAAGGGQPPAAAIPRPRTPMENQPSTAATPPTAVTPVVVVPSMRLPSEPGPVDTPVVAVSPAVITAPAVSFSAPEGVRVGPAEVVTPDVGVGDVQAGPVGLSATKVGLPDLAVSTASVGDAVVLPAVSVSPTTITTPDLKLGRAEVPLPDVALPAVDLPSVALPVTAPVRAVTGVVGGLLGR